MHLAQGGVLVSEKKKSDFGSQEEQAMQAIRKVIGDPLGMELYELWKEYEELRTVEAIYCKASTSVWER